MPLPSGKRALVAAPRVPLQGHCTCSGASCPGDRDDPCNVRHRRRIPSGLAGLWEPRRDGDRNPAGAVRPAAGSSGATAACGAGRHCLPAACHTTAGRLPLLSGEGLAPATRGCIKPTNVPRSGGAPQRLAVRIFYEVAETLLHRLLLALLQLALLHSPGCLAVSVVSLHSVRRLQPVGCALSCRPE